MNHPEGYIIDPSLVYKLKKSLYGLKQAPREWYSKMDAFLLSQNFQGVDQIQMCIYRSIMVILLLFFLYFDDLLITGNTVASISAIKTALHNAFEMSDLGLLK